MSDSNPKTRREVWDERRAELGRNVLALIESRRMSFADAADATGLSKTALYKIADGKSDPCLSSLWAIAEFFGVSFDSLIAPLR